MSKAFRRLHSFATFQEKYFDQYLADPVLDTEEGVVAVDRFMPMQIPEWTCKAGNVMWVMDLKQCVSNVIVSHRALIHLVGSRV